MKKEQLTKILIANNTNNLVIDKLTDLLLESKGQNFQEFNETVENFFWEIQDHHNIFENEKLASDYFDKNLADYMQNGKISWISEFWGLPNFADLPNIKMAAYMLGNLEQNNFNKINQDVFNLINQ